MRWRIIFLIVVFLLPYPILIFRIYNLQLAEGNYYLTRAASQRKASGVLEAERGNIYFNDKNNNRILAALDKEYAVIYAVPKEIHEGIKNGDTESFLKETSEKLSLIVKAPAEEIEKKIGKKNDLYELLTQKADVETVNNIKNLNLKGVYVDYRPFRFYPFEKLASHLLGFVTATDEEMVGRYGVESAFNKILAGESGRLENNDLIKPKNGENIILTIDRNIQAEAEEILTGLVKKYEAKGGTVIVEEPASGKILAMASYPDFDPNNYSEYEIKNFLNPAVQAIYEPGSVFKVITMAAGIDSGKITPETPYTDYGSVTLNSKTIRNWDLKAHGVQTMTGVIEQSINTGAIFAQQKMGPDIFYNYLVKFGFNELTSMGLPGEVRGNINNLKKGKEIDFATASFGQGVAVTPISLINAVSAIANGGVLMKPFILADEQPQEIRRVISAETAEKVTKMMVSAVEKNVVAVIPSYSVAGKTGTAFIPDFGGKGYSDKVINTYVGFAPANNKISSSKFIVLIKLDEPVGSPLAGQTVVPAFQKLTAFILNYYNIPPDMIATSH
ncbi:penicillin-binding protein 2 [Candidatus Wolfebacteria bacterium]|nr:penicillin-binding protein 2 [Candidatus Wolfebacteria bacterium]